MKKIILSLFVLTSVLSGCKSDSEAPAGKPLTGKKATAETTTPQFGDGLIVNDGMNGSLSLSSIASWSKVADAASYEVAIGTIPGSNNIKDWVNVGETINVSLSVISTLNNGQIYYTNVRAINKAGVAGAIKSGDGWVAIGEWKVNTLALKYNDYVNTVAFDKDQNQYVGGEFSSVNSTNHNNIILLTSNGVVDTSINFAAGFNQQVEAKVLSSGKIMIAGYATTYNATAIKKIARLNSNATLDSAFNLDSTINAEINWINNIEVDSLGNTYAVYYTTGGYKIVKINPNGSVNNDFNTNYGSDRFNGRGSVNITSDDKVILSGYSIGVNVISSTAILEEALPVQAYFAKKLSNGNMLVLGNEIVAMYDSSYNPVVSFNNNISAFASNAHWYNGFFETPDGGVVIYGDADESFKGIRKFLPSGLEDAAFNSMIGDGILFSESITDIKKTSDNKLVLTGNFRTINSQSISYGIAKLNTDGSRDMSFIPLSGGFSYSGKSTLNILAGDKILVTGGFDSFGGTRVNSLVKINKDKTIDQVFATNLKVNGHIKDVVFSNNLIYIAGHFSKVNGQVANGIARLKMDGSLDTSFNSRNAFVNEFPSKLTILKDGNLLATGGFWKFNNYSTFSMVKILKDGSRDTTFNLGSGFNSTVNTVDELPDGKLIVGGDFSTYRGVTANKIIRLNPNGSIDSSFSTGIGFNNSVTKLKALASGKIIIYGLFTTYKGLAHHNLLRLNPDGGVDADFDIGVGFGNQGAVMEFTSDNNMVFAGNTSQFNGNNVGPIFRLNSEGMLDQSLDTTSLALLINAEASDLKVSPDGRVFPLGYFTNSGAAISYSKEYSW